MDKSLKSRVSENRRLLENPYAHIDYLEVVDGNALAERGTEPLDHRISARSMVLQDPYAYSDDSGCYGAEVNLGDKKSPLHQSKHSPSDSVISGPGKARTSLRRYTNRKIEALAKDLHKRLWKERMSLWRGHPPTDPIDLLDTAVALSVVGYDFSLEEGLGQYRGEGGQIEVAGLIDRASKEVRVSRQFPTTVQAFTAAHELGHAVLHREVGGVHRDRPLDGAMPSRDPRELEADKFATYFLMPAKLVRPRFYDLFRTERFALTDDTAFALSNLSLDEVQRTCRMRRDLSRLLASTESYNGRYFPSLAAQFRVSVEAMAIRIEELGLLNG
jgi:Zn-dependent peptidase ImmA (M78 family)